MAKPLVIVESPAKAKTISKFLGKDWVVEASIGHVRDLPSSASEIPAAVKSEAWARLGVNVDDGYTPLYVVLPEKKAKIRELKAKLKDASALYLATDEDREGEAISWHLLELLKPKVPVKRMVFHEITKAAIEAAVKNCRDVDASLVDAQEARRILDRLYGYEVSPVLWRKIAPRLSAGRVQSVATRLIVEREKERMAFRSASWWDANVTLAHAGTEFPASVVSLDGKTIAQGRDFGADGKLQGGRGVVVLDEAAATTLSAGLQGRTARVRKVEEKEYGSSPKAPFTTSTLQQEAGRKLGMTAKRAMQAAQRLYENGFITYMRTDSTHLSGDALNLARNYIEKNFGKSYLPEKPNFFSSSNKDAQEAHEAIRPTNVALTPNRVKNALQPDQFRLYQLIWERFLACQMTPAQWDSTAVTITGGKSRTLTFRATGRVLAFDGFYKVTGVPQAADEQNLPALKEQQPLFAFGIDVDQRFSSPPPRYTEASLIKMLESEGIGRPSTYASIISVIQDRQYVEQLERRFYSTDLGEVVTDKLIEAFPEIMDVGYTREMETELDKVEEDHIDWVEMLRRFYGPFTKSLAAAMEQLSHAKAETSPAPDEYKCPTCNAGLVYRFGKNGRFLSCSRYPDCTYASPVDREGKPRPAAESANIACPKCGSPMNKRVGRFGPFLGCSRYNDKANPCDGILNIDRKGKVVAPSPKPLLTDLPCPTCGSPLNLRSGVKGPWLGCSTFPKCRGRGKWAEIPEEKRNEIMKAFEAHEKSNTVPIIKTLDGKPLTDAKGKPLPEAPTVDALAGKSDAPETFESVAEEIGV